MDLRFYQASFSLSISQHFNALVYTVYTSKLAPDPAIVCASNSQKQDGSSLSDLF